MEIVADKKQDYATFIRSWQKHDGKKGDTWGAYNTAPANLLTTRNYSSYLLLPTEYTEWQWPLSGIHSISMKKISQAS